MKLALVMMFAQGEMPFLRLHLPAYKDAFDGIVAITDPKCTDGSLEYMKSIGAEILIEPWTHHWGDFATKLMKYAEQLGFDGVLRLDPDEAIFAEDALKIKGMLENEATLLLFPRHEFFGSRLTVRPDLYPDHQARAFRLNRGIIIQGRRHEGISFQEHSLSEHATDPDKRVLRIHNGVHLWHYGWASRGAILRNMLKYQNHARAEAGIPQWDSLPAEMPMVQFPTVRFFDPQPIDPYEVGICAPFFQEAHNAKG